MVDVNVFHPTTTTSSSPSPPHLAPNLGNQAVRAPPHSRDVGMFNLARRDAIEGLGREEQKGGPRKWEALAVRHENGPRRLSGPAFLPSISSRPPANDLKPHTVPTACITTTMTAWLCKLRNDTELQHQGTKVQEDEGSTMPAHDNEGRITPA
jgi:hypothetical protein